MTTKTTPRMLFGAALLACAAMNPAWAAKKGDAMPVDDAYQRERAACLSGQTGQERTACLREAAAARDEARRNRLGNGVSAEQKEANKLERCKAVKPEDKADCEKLARGEGVERGSVAGGGVIKETVTRTVGAEGAASSPAARR